MTTKATNTLFRNLLNTYLTLKLGRKPTEEEMLEEAMKNGVTDKVCDNPPRDYENESDWPSEADMIDHGYWPPKEDK